MRRHLPLSLPAFFLSIFLLVAGLIPVTSARADDAAAADPQTVSADALPTAQINGVVWDQAVVGNTVYVAGSFTSARPAGSAAGENEQSRSNLMAYDLTTGDLLSWAPSANGDVNSIEASADGSTLYVGGSFTQLNGANAYRVGAISAADGSSRSLGLKTNATVKAVALSADGSTLYIGGSFTEANSAARYRVAAFNLKTNKLTDFAPHVDNFSVRALTASPDGNGVAIGGAFTSVDSSDNPGYGLAILENDGSLRNNEINTVVRNADTYGAIMSLRSDSKGGLYGVGFSQSSRQANIEGMFRADWTTGKLSFLADCHGDSYDVLPAGDVVYVASHTHDCSNIGGFPNSTTEYHHGVAFTNYATGTVGPNTARYYADHQGEPAPTNLNFYPAFTTGTYTGVNQATWTVEGNSDYVAYGGEFTAVNGTSQQGLVRFARRDIAPNKMGPENKGGAYKVTADSVDSGVVTLSFQANWDRDDKTLTYKVYRDTTDSQPVSTQTVTAGFWELPQLTATDTVDPGTSHRYRVVVEDKWGASTYSDWVSVTAAGQLGDKAPQQNQDGQQAQGDQAQDGQQQDQAQAQQGQAGQQQDQGQAQPGQGDQAQAGQQAQGDQAQAGQQQGQGQAQPGQGDQAQAGQQAQGDQAQDGQQQGQGQAQPGQGDQAQAGQQAQGDQAQDGQQQDQAQAQQGQGQAGQQQGQGQAQPGQGDQAQGWGDQKAAEDQQAQEDQQQKKDDQQAQDAQQQKPAVKADDVAAGQAIFEDSFDRSTTAGWGTASTGGDWTVDWGRNAYSTLDSKGRVALAGARSSTSIHSPVIDSTATESQVDLSMDALAGGNGAYITYVGRQTDSGRYQTEFRVASDGTVTMTVAKRVDGTETVLGTAPVGTYKPGEALHLRLALDGADASASQINASTAVRARAWIGDTEPSAWQVDTTDDDAALAAPGSVGLMTYVSASAGGETVNLDVDSVKVNRLH